MCFSAVQYKNTQKIMLYSVLAKLSTIKPFIFKMKKKKKRSYTDNGKAEHQGGE